MELYVSDHPVDSLDRSKYTDVDLLETAEEVGLDGGALRLRRRTPPQSRHRRFQSLFQLRSGQMHRLLALRARLRGGAGHLRADRLRPRLRFDHRRRDGREVHRIRMRLLRRLRAGLPDRLAAGEESHREGQAGMVGDHDLRLLRRRLRVQGGDARRRSRAHGAVQGRQGEPRPFLRQGPLRLGLRQSPGTHPQADAAREDQRPVARGVVGRGDRPRRLRVQAHPGEIRPRLDRRHHLVALHRRRNLPGAEAGARRRSATTTSTPAPASAIRRPATA